MANYIYRITEKNVDGCGGDATEFALFHQPLNRAECALFARILQEAKGKLDDNDTAGMIADALVKFAEESGVKGVTCGAPYAGTFEF